MTKTKKSRNLDLQFQKNKIKKMNKNILLYVSKRFKMKQVSFCEKYEHIHNYKQD